MRNLRKKFKRPKKPWDIEQIGERNRIRSEFGLRRAKEVYVAREVLRGYRQRARQLIAKANEVEKKMLLGKLAKLGILKEGAGLDDVLALDVRNILERRLQTVVFRKGMASSMKHARQLIVHGRVSVSGLRTKFPSYLVTADEEGRVGWFRGEPKRAEGVKKKHARRGVDAAESAGAAAQAEQPEIIEEGAAAEETVEEAG